MPDAVRNCQILRSHWDHLCAPADAYGNTSGRTLAQHFPCKFGTTVGALKTSLDAEPVRWFAD
jgi:hypothetical protein